MSSRSPRPRRAPSSGTRKNGNGKPGGGIPFAALVAGIIIAGFGVGALIAAFAQRRSETRVAQVTTVVTPTPAAKATRPPVIIATLAPARTPRPLPTPKPTPSTAASPSPRPSPTATAEAPSPPPAASALPTQPSGTPSSVPTRKPTPLPTQGPRVTPAPVKTAVPTVAPTAAPTPADVVQADSAVASSAAALVRRYIDALRSGNENAAYAALGGAAGDRGLALTEEQFIDASAKVTRIRAKQVGESSASVEAYISTAKGEYFATFHVGRTSNGAVIETHDWIKP